MTSLASSPAFASSESWVDRHFSRLLLLLAGAGLIPCLVYGNIQFVEFDGWWHLFTATQDRWLMLLGEWKYDAHPPLFYLILRFAAIFGHSHLVMRSIGIACGAMGSYVFGIIGGKLYRYKASALLAAAAYTFSWSMIEIDCDVRAYPMALLFVLLTLNAWVDFAMDPSGSGSDRAVLRFGIYSLLALLSEYYVAFFLAGCAAILVLHALLRPGFRAALVSSLRRSWKAWLFAGAAPALTFLVLYAVHMRNQAPIQYYLRPYYWTDDSPLGLDGFLLGNFEKEIGYFTPFNIDTGIMLAAAALLFVAGVWFAVAGKNRRPVALSSFPPLMLMILLGELVILSLAARYPFGGELRHQSIIAPFVFLTAFLAIDGLAGLFQARMVRNVVFAAAGVLIAASFAYSWTVFPWDPVEPLTAEYARFREAFPTADTVYGDATSMIFFYSQTHRSKWIFQDRFLIDGQRIAVYSVDDGRGHPIRILKNKLNTYFDLANPEVYQTLADTLRHENLRSAVLFYEGLAWNQEGAKVLEDKFKTLGSLAGLDYGRYSMGTSYAFIEFKLR